MHNNYHNSCLTAPSELFYPNTFFISKYLNYLSEIFETQSEGRSLKKSTSKEARKQPYIAEIGFGSVMFSLLLI